MIIKKVHLRFFRSIHNSIKRISLEWLFVFALIFLEPFTIIFTIIFKLGRKYERNLYNQEKKYKPKGILMTNKNKRNEQDNIIESFNF